MVAPLLTVEFYLDDGSPVPAFQPFTCASRAEILPAALHLMGSLSLRSLEVKEFGVHLFTLKG